MFKFKVYKKFFKRFVSAYLYGSILKPEINNTNHKKYYG